MELNRQLLARTIIVLIIIDIFAFIYISKFNLPQINPESFLSESELLLYTISGIISITGLFLIFTVLGMLIILWYQEELKKGESNGENPIQKKET